MKSERNNQKTRYLIITLGLLLSVFSVGKAFKTLLLNIDVHPNAGVHDVEEVPTADFNFSQSESCADAPIHFTDNSTGADLTYLWNFGDGQTSTVKNPIHSFSTATGTGTQTFQVTLTVTNELDESNSITKEVEVNSIPSLQIGSNQEYVLFDNKPFFVVCGNLGADFTFYNQSSTTDTNTSYKIDWGDESTPFEGTAWTALTHNFEVGITSVTYTVTGPSCTVTENFYVFVGSNPAVGLGNPGNTNVCS